jgi:calcium homeostasis ER protein
MCSFYFQTFEKKLQQLSIQTQQQQRPALLSQPILGIGNHLTIPTSMGTPSLKPGLLGAAPGLPNLPSSLDTPSSSSDVSIPDIPDISRPPPGFPPPIVSEKELMPALPYYELPAGLMVPLVKVQKLLF